MKLLKRLKGIRISKLKAKGLRVRDLFKVQKLKGLKRPSLKGIDFKSKMGAKLMVVLILLSVIPTMVLGSYSYRRTFEELRTGEIGKYSIYLNGITNSMRNAIRDTEFILKTLSSSNEFQELLEEKAEFGRVESLEAQEGADRVLRKIYVDSMGYYESIIVVDRNLETVADSLGRTGYSLGLEDMDFVRESMEGDTMTVSEMYFSDISQTDVPVAMNSMAYPIKHQTGQVLGAVVVSFDFKNFSSEVTSSEVSQNGKGYIMGESGVYLTNPDTNKVLERADGDINLEILSRVNEGSENMGYNTKTVNGENWTYFFSAIPRTTWIVVFSIPESDYLVVANEIRNNTITIIALGSILAVIVGAIFVSRQVKNIKNMARNMEEIAEGDFTVESSSTSKDEFMDLSNSINNMVKRQNGVLKKIILTADRLKQASGDMKDKAHYAESYTKEIASISEELLKNAEENISSIESINEMIEDVRVKAKLSQDKSQVAVGESLKVQEYTEIGLRAVERANLNMEKVDHVVTNNIEDVKALVSSSEEIYKFIGYIKDISKQTNLLALNASIEAARAGEGGRGFSVVAEEIRKLSKDSNDASADIEKVLEAIIHDIKKVDSDMENTKAQFEENKKSNTEVKTSFDHIYNSVYELNRSIEESNNSAKDQKQSMDYISSQVGSIEARVKDTFESAKKLDSGTDHQEEAMTDILEVSNRLDTMSDEMVEIHSKFIVTDKYKKDRL